VRSKKYGVSGGGQNQKPLAGRNLVFHTRWETGLIRDVNLTLQLMCVRRCNVSHLKKEGRSVRQPHRPTPRHHFGREIKLK